MFDASPWQPSLLDASVSKPEPDRAFADLVRLDLGQGAWVDHQLGWLRGADSLFADLLESAPFEQRQMTIFGKRLDQPRLTTWWEDPAHQAPGPVEAMRQALRERYEEPFDAVGINLYRDGRDSVAWHADRHARGPGSPDVVVAIVSLGDTRRFLLRPRVGGGPSQAFDLHAGDLLVMGGSCQRTRQHTIPKTARPVGPRMSVTFRHPPEAELGDPAPVATAG
ncbi:MAG: putative alkylated repair protein [Actinomycetia bacterium]|nr:putative alkylated repair protein [Actinomycetes bacterium]